jgi:hypothetical protein
MMGQIFTKVGQVNIGQTSVGQILSIQTEKKNIGH